MFNNRIVAHQLIRDQPPPTPKCFDSRESWQSFLISASASGEQVIRRTDVGKHAGNRQTGYAFVLPIVAHCLDCPREYRERMRRAGRCQPAITLDPPLTNESTMTPDIRRSIAARQQRITESDGGVFLSKSRRDALEAGRLAAAE